MRLPVPFHSARRMQRPTEVVQRPLVPNFIAEHRRRDPVRLVVGPTSADGLDMINRREQFPEGKVRLGELPVRMCREVLPELDMEEAQNAGVNESFARVAVDEAITQEQRHGFTD